jgi:nitrile hydratase
LKNEHVCTRFHEQIDAFRKAWRKVIAKAWSDSAFKQRLMEDPITVLAENKIYPPSPGAQCKILENTNKILYLILPDGPEGELDEEFLKSTVNKNKKEQVYADHQAWTKIVAKALSDSTFKQRLIKDPKKRLKRKCNPASFRIGVQNSGKYKSIDISRSSRKSKGSAW